MISDSKTNIRKPAELLVFAVTIGMLIFASGCSRSEDQVEFEREAFRTPENYTETTPSGEVVSRDESDWQIGPMFQGFVEVEVPAFPNPTRSENVRIELLITGVGTVDGLRAVGYYDMFDQRSYRVLYEHDRSPLNFGHMTFTINPADFGVNRSYNAARQVNDGLHRLFIYDGRDNLITYGDIKLK
ncbi:hypothetical protein [Natronogracilivirga saccharolytica]|uniref:Uncharacterized protein n=1 Tax=Natronogracilivirga saccharolytica TaxID=2812953 RepID=A0A8J7UWV6_9BACT|nr:hypothetical protein [Natronogracilivirga saccharolytica]MBP3192654.1 hypothetical protein [Natronogracilivirga saccharolytica]